MATAMAIVGTGHSRVRIASSIHVLRRFTADQTGTCITSAGRPHGIVPAVRLPTGSVRSPDVGIPVTRQRMCVRATYDGPVQITEPRAAREPRLD